ncbi:hypothetical protein AB0I66_32130 [Streptomyces sp. NPDC050439]|uniref:hypothetical protein n=1 Tax=unclassified Streptomyces TaxID=2593676 RepID=UPI00344481DE
MKKIAEYLRTQAPQRSMRWLTPKISRGSTRRSSVIDAHEGRADDKPDSGRDGKGGKGSGAEDAALKRAKEDLESARGRFNSAVGDYDERSGHFAGKIRESIDDDMADSWWNDAKGAIADADWIGEWADRLSWVATAVGVAAMLFPGIGWIAAALTVAVLIAHAAQATTGNGSWFDVIMDIGALKLARNGMRAAKGIKLLQNSSRKVASKSSGTAQQVQSASKTAGSRASSVAKSRKGGGRSGNARNNARARNMRQLAKSRADGKKAAGEVRDAEMPQITAQEKAGVLGDAQLGRQMKDIKKWHAEFPADAQLAANARQAERHRDALVGSWGASTVLDSGDKAGDQVSGGEYSRMKDRMTRSVGSRW